MFTEHSVEYELLGGTRKITRQVFTTRDGRILGTENTSERVWRGYDGWRTYNAAPVTCQFHTREEASAWVDAMFAERDVFLAQDGRPLAPSLA